MRNPWVARGRVRRVSRRALRTNANTSVGRPPRGVVLHADRSDSRASFGQPCNRLHRNRGDSAPGYPRVRSSARPATPRRGRPIFSRYSDRFLFAYDEKKKKN